MKRSLGLLLLVSLSAAPAFGEGRDSLRKTKNLGVMLGLLDPYPSLIGVTAGYSTSSTMRLELGVGRRNLDLSHVTTWAIGAKFFVPHWNLTPWASIHVAGVSHEGRDAILGFASSGMHGYAGLGVEWMTESGFTASFGFHVSTKGNSLSEPMLAIGWFFDV